MIYLSAAIWFRKNSPTELAALELLDRVLGQMDKHKIPINFHIDFDSLRHDILLDKHNASSQKTNRELLKQSKTVYSDWQHKVHNVASFYWSSTRFDCWSSPF